MAEIPVDGRLLTLDELEAVCAELCLEDVRKVVIHHTGNPDEATWQKWGGWRYWCKVLKRFYESKGWVRGPHLFVGPDGIGYFYPLDRPGRAIGGGYNERGVRHVEIVGNFNGSLPEGAVLDYAASAAAILLRAAGLTVGDGLSHHTLMVGRGVTDCPGRQLQADWWWFKDEVRERMW